MKNTAFMYSREAMAPNSTDFAFHVSREKLILCEQKAEQVINYKLRKKIGASSAQRAEILAVSRTCHIIVNATSML